MTRRRGGGFPLSRGEPPPRPRPSEEKTITTVVAFDPYRRCLDQCIHDLAHGVLIAELLGGDGPPRVGLIVALTAHLDGS